MPWSSSLGLLRPPLRSPRQPMRPTFGNNLYVLASVLNRDGPATLLTLPMGGTAASPSHQSPPSPHFPFPQYHTSHWISWSRATNSSGTPSSIWHAGTEGIKRWSHILRRPRRRSELGRQAARRSSRHRRGRARLRRCWSRTSSRIADVSCV